MDYLYRINKYFDAPKPKHKLNRSGICLPVTNIIVGNYDSRIVVAPYYCSIVHWAFVQLWAR